MGGLRRHSHRSRSQWGGNRTSRSRWKRLALLGCVRGDAAFNYRRLQSKPRELERLWLAVYWWAGNTPKWVTEIEHARMKIQS